MIIGKEGQQPFVITDPMVSRKHCKLTKIDTNTFEIEDLDSRNGTFVNGISIVKCKVTKADKIMLGPNFPLSIDECFPQTNGSKNSPPTPPESHFPDHLRHVYTCYQKADSQLKTKLNMLGYVRALPTLISGIITKLATTEKSDLLSWGLTIGVAAIAFFISYKVAKKICEQTNDQIIKNKNNLQINYIDGNCKKFIGDKPPESFEMVGCKCPHCKKIIK